MCIKGERVKMSYTYVIGENSVTLFNFTNGNKVTIFEDDSRYSKFVELVKAGDYTTAENLDVKAVVQKFGMASTSGNFGVVINDGVGLVQFAAQEYPLSDAITKRILKMSAEGFDAKPLVNFLENLYNNPSKTAVDELFLFLDSTELPITQDGYFIAYKIVREDYRDIYSGKFSHHIGATVSMPRFEVDDKRSNTCSSGLHFCSKDYLAHYGSQNKDTDRCVLVKINPKDVVSIPSDYNNAKGRTCSYTVIGEMQEKDWREILAERDYNSSSVVDDDGFDYDDYEEDDVYEWSAEEEDCEEVTSSTKLKYFEFDVPTRRWKEKRFGEIATRNEVCLGEDLTLEQVIRYEELALKGGV